MSISSSTADSGGRLPAWPGEYLRDHAVHVAVVVAFALYPAFWHAGHGLIGGRMSMIFPRMQTMTAILYFGLFAISFDFVSGYTGYLSFGHAAFYGTGAYFVLMAANDAIPFVDPEMHFVLLMVLAALVAVVVAAAIGLVAFRLTGVYFAMITLGFAELLFVLSETAPFISAPEDGIILDPGVGRSDPFQIGIPFVDTLNAHIGDFGDSFTLVIGNTELFVLDNRALSFYLVGLVVLLCYLIMQRIVHSPFGRVMIAIRENEERAEAIGYRTFYYKFGAFLISAFFAAVAGALFAGFEEAVDPETSFYFLVTGFALVAAIIGGLGTLVGPLYGVLFFETTQEFLSTSGGGGGLVPLLRDVFPASVMETELLGTTVNGLLRSFLAGHGEFYLGIVFVVFVLYVPQGVMGSIRNRVGGPVATVVSERLRRGEGD